MFSFEQMPDIQQMPVGEETPVKEQKRPELPNFEIKEDFILDGYNMLAKYHKKPTKERNRHTWPTYGRHITNGIGTFSEK